MALVNAFGELNLEATQLQVRDYLDTVELKLQSIRDRLDGAMALDNATLTALETINAIVSGSVSVSNMIPAVETGLAKEATLGARASETKLEAVRALLAATLQVVGVVALDTNTLAALETIQVGNFPVSQAVTGPLTDAQLRAIPVPVAFPADEAGLTDDQLRATAVPISGTVAVNNLPATQPVSGTVGVDNFPASQPVTGAFFQATQPVSGPLTDAQLRATPPAIKDDYDDREILADQSGAGAVLTFTFTQQVHMVMITTRGTDLVCRVDPKGGTTSASFGQPIFDGATGYFPMKTSVVKVFAPSGTTVTVMGLYRV